MTLKFDVVTEGSSIEVEGETLEQLELAACEAGLAAREEVYDDRGNVIGWIGPRPGSWRYR